MCKILLLPHVSPTLSHVNVGPLLRLHWINDNLEFLHLDVYMSSLLYRTKPWTIMDHVLRNTKILQSVRYDPPCCIMQPGLGLVYFHHTDDSRVQLTFKLEEETGSLRHVCVWIDVSPHSCNSEFCANMCKSSACTASSLTVYFFNLIRIHRTDYLYYVNFVGLMVTVEMCVGISVSCMPLIARLHKAKKEKLRANLTLAGKKLKNLIYKAKSKRVSEKRNADLEIGTYDQIDAIRGNSETSLKTPDLVIVSPMRNVEHDPAQLDVHITRATMSFATQSSSSME